MTLPRHGHPTTQVAPDNALEDGHVSGAGGRVERDTLVCVAVVRFVGSTRAQPHGDTE